MANQTTDIFAISTSALKAQDERMKVIAENIANATTTPESRGARPYQRQVVTFKNEFDKALGAYKVKVTGVSADKSDFIKKFDPSNPVADAQGYVQMPNVNPLLEQMDMSEANRAYEANLAVITASRTMVMKTIGLLN
ncbi:MAG: flagellar basal body rod protein FlgC [Alphaproteobacteria bacterium]|nr:flagellar basal body rod protein FlgC [Alphaproteobacteria bacterium]